MISVASVVDRIPTKHGNGCLPRIDVTFTPSFKSPCRFSYQRQYLFPHVTTIQIRAVAL